MLVIFDLDGTLLNTMDDLAAAANHALTVSGFAVRTVEECRGFVGNGVTKLLERALPEHAKTPTNLQQLSRAFLDYYDKNLWNHTQPYQGIPQVLQQLQTKGVKLAVASNKYQSATERLIGHFFPQISFVAVWGQRANIPLKPHPQVVTDILVKANEPRENVLYIGDSDVDMQTAQNAGVKVCAVTWGFRSRAVLAACRPNYMISTPQEILCLL